MYNLVVSGWLYIEISDTQLLEDQKNAKPNWKANCVWCHMWQSSKRGTLCGKSSLSEGWEPLTLQHVQTKLTEKNKFVPLSLPSFIKLIIHSSKDLLKEENNLFIYYFNITFSGSSTKSKETLDIKQVQWFSDFPFTTSSSLT